MEYGPIKHFMDIEAWKLARELKISVYSVVKKLPREDNFDLASQMRRAAVSCTANMGTFDI
jgi:four helix bundle protein